MKKKKTPEFWQDRIKVAMKWRDRKLDDLGVDRFVKEYGGEYDVRLGQIQAPPINDVFAYTQAAIAGLSAKDPYITVNAEQPATIQGSHLLEESVNYYWRMLKTKEETDLEVLDTTLAGHAWHKVGNKTKTTEVNGQLQISSEKLYSDRVSWRDVVFNIGSRRPPIDCLWMAQRIIKPTDQVKEDYKGTSDIVGGPHPSLNDDDYKASSFKDDIMFSTLWEIWDSEEKKVKLICEGHDKFLKETPWPPYLGEFPFQMLWFNAIPDEPYPLPDIKPWEPQILEKIKLLAMALNHVKRWNRQMLVQEGMIKASELDKFEKGIDGMIISVQGPVGTVAAPLAYAALQPEIFTLFSLLDQIANNTNGQPAVDRGATMATKTRTLGELEMIKSGAKSRTDRKVARVEDHIENIARHLIAHMQANFDLEQVIKITGERPAEVIQAFGNKYDPKTQTIRFTKDDIQGQYGVKVKAGSTLPLDKQTRMAILQQVLQSAEQLAAMPQLPPFIQVVISEILRDYDIEELKVAFKAQSDAAAQSQGDASHEKAVEVDKTQAEADKRKAQAANIQADTTIKTGEALYKAHQAGVLPEAVQLGQGMGHFPGNGR